MLGDFYDRSLFRPKHERKRFYVKRLFLVRAQNCKRVKKIYIEMFFSFFKNKKKMTFTLGKGSEIWLI